jgi:hypothetical protein
MSRASCVFHPWDGGSIHYSGCLREKWTFRNITLLLAIIWMPEFYQYNAWVRKHKAKFAIFGVLILKTSPSHSGIRLKSWLIIIWVWPILFCSTEAPAINWWVEWWAKACKLCLFGILSECKTGLKISACHDCKYRRVTHSLWRMAVKCLLSAGEIRRSPA